MNKIYGVRNGVVSECRAKDPAHCPYHTSHGSFEDMERIADKKNEALQNRLEEMQSTRLFKCDTLDPVMRKNIDDALSDIVSGMDDGKNYSFDEIRDLFLEYTDTGYQGINEIDYYTINDVFEECDAYPKSWSQTGWTSQNKQWLYATLCDLRTDELREQIQNGKEKELFKDFLAENDYDSSTSFKNLTDDQEENLVQYLHDKSQTDLMYYDQQISYLDENYDNIRYEALERFDVHFPSKETLLKEAFLIDYVDSDKGIFCGLKDQNSITKEDMEDQLNLIQSIK